MKTLKKLCILCDFYSSDVAACFHPDAWTPGERWRGFKVPGDIMKLNPRGKCSWFERVSTRVEHRLPLWMRVYMLAFRVRKFFRRFGRKK